MVPQQPPTTLTPSSPTKRAVVLGELLGREVVVHLAVDDHGRPALGRHEIGMRAWCGEVAQVLAHLGRARWRS